MKKSYISSDGEELYMYILSDEDGTEHYFLPVNENGINSTTKYQDDDGLQLILDTSSSVLTITDDTKNVRSYTQTSSTPSGVLGSWYLTSITDAIGNKIVFGFSGEKPVSIGILPNASSQINYLTITYGTNNMPIVIMNQRTREAIVFRYSETATGSIVATENAKYLRQVVYAHSASDIDSAGWSEFYMNTSSSTDIVVDATAAYTYNSSGYLTKATDTLSGYEIRYSYSSGRVYNIIEYGDGETGQRMRITYNDGYTEVRSSGSDDKYNTTDDIITRYNLDSEGRVISMYSTDSAKNQIYGASAGVYETQDNVKNNLKSTVVVGGTTSNYILNGGFEKSSENSAENWNLQGNVIYNAALTDSYENVGSKNAYFTITDNSQNYLYQYTHLKEGTYTLSAYFGIFACENVKLYMQAESIDSGSIYVEEIPINENYASGQFFSYSMTFEAYDYNSTGGENFKISFYTIAENVADSGVLVRVDNVSLEKSISPSNFSMVQYGNFEKFPIDSTGASLSNGTNAWSTEGGAFTTTYVSEPFGNVYTTSGDITTAKYIKQTVYTISDYDKANYEQYGLDHFEVNGYPSSKNFIVSGFAKGTGQVNSKNSKFALRLDVAYYQGLGSDDLVIPYYFEFEHDCFDWQFISGTVSTLSNALIHYVDIVCEYSNQPGGEAYFDEIAVIESIDDSIVQYEYYENGLLKRQTTGYYEEFYEYNEDRQLIRMTNSRNQMIEYVYNSNGVTVDSEILYNYTQGAGSTLILEPVTKTDYTYNAFGQTTSSSTYEAVFASDGTTLVAKSGTDYVITGYSYETTAGSPIFGAMLREEDNLNIWTTYHYDNNNGRLLAVINSDQGTGTCYTYDAVGNITSVMPALYTSSTGYSTVSDSASAQYTYNEANLLTSITTDSTTYTFTYDAFGKSDSVSAGGNEIVNYEYNSYNGKLSKINYANGFSVRYVYDTLENIKEVWYNDGVTETQAFEYTYTSYGQLARFDNLLTGKSAVYKYDIDNRLIGYIEYDCEEKINEFSSSVSYTDRSEVEYVNYKMDYACGSSIAYWNLRYHHLYNDTDGTIRSYGVTTEETNGDITYTYDTFKRLSQKTYSFNLSNSSETGYTNTVSYTFLSSPWSSTRTSALVETFTSQVNDNTAVTYTYEYDYNGNVTKITRGSSEYRYEYDDLGQLLREDNTDTGRTYVYTYDDAGNIISKKTYALTAKGSTPTTLYSTYTYGYTSAWGDQLTSYNGVSITYDAIGNPLSYYNGASYTFTWENARQLATAVKGGNTLSFEYNDEGMRTRKTVNGIDITYHLSGSLIIAEEWGTSHIIYLYDTDGTPIGMQYRTSSYAEGVFDTYWFEKNLQGDIVAVYSENGTKLVSYTYDAWGNCTTTYYNGGASTTAIYNPFRYRGYYLDTETGLYYLQSRYYDPVIGRFVNPDDITLLGANGDFASLNLYAYCGNNPVARADDGGEAWHVIAGILLGAAGKALDMYHNGELDWSDWRTYARIGVSAISGGISAAVGPLVGTIISGISNGVDSALSGNDFNQIMQDTASGIISAGIISGIGEVAKLIPGSIVAKKFLNNASQTQLKQFANSLGYVGRNYKQVTAWTGKIMFDAACNFSDNIPSKAFGMLATWVIERASGIDWESKLFYS